MKKAKEVKTSLKNNNSNKTRKTILIILSSLAIVFFLLFFVNSLQNISSQSGKIDIAISLLLIISIVFIYKENKLALFLFTILLITHLAVLYILRTPGLTLFYSLITYLLFIIGFWFLFFIQDKLLNKLKYIITGILFIFLGIFNIALWMYLFLILVYRSSFVLIIFLIALIYSTIVVGYLSYKTASLNPRLYWLWGLFSLLPLLVLFLNPSLKIFFIFLFLGFSIYLPCFVGGLIGYLVSKKTR
ncbi:MAG: hypothetical protein ACP5OG_06200 [Candidatus Nanoarchaeia archaeon]